MASSSPEDPEAGYATAAAALIALALALVAAAVVNAGAANLKLARSDLRDAEREMALNSAQSMALPTLLVQASGPRLSWTIPSQSGPVEVLAERERQKLSVEAMIALPDDVFHRLGVVDPERLRNRLRALASPSGSGATAMADLDPAPQWRGCAPSLISPHGRGAALAFPAAQPPTPTLTPSPAGEVWRVRASSKQGWVEERIIRLTGDARRPSAIIERRYGRQPKEQARCEELVG